MLVKYQIVLIVLCALGLQGCDKEPWNDPYPHFDKNERTLYTVFVERPKHLDPAISYSADEWIFTNQIYEPPLQYHYLKRPYELVPLMAQTFPQVHYEDKEGNLLASNAPIDQVAYSIYRITIKPRVYYQPHPAFVKDPKTQQFCYHHLNKRDLRHINSLKDFPQMDSREVTAHDYVYEIKRIADPRLNSPIYGIMEGYIVGLSDFFKQVQNAQSAQGIQADQVQYFDLNAFDISGVKVIDRYTYEIKIKGVYPQFIYWLAMPFFAPMPWEAIQFYAQSSLAGKNISLDWFPVGTGPYLLQENNPNLQMMMVKNPNYHGENYPSEGMPEDQENGLLENAGKPLPFLDKIVFISEKEDIPYWNKFLQGYYDQAGVDANNFDQALSVGLGGQFELSETLKQKGIKLTSSVQPSVFYWGFNMLDKTVGGNNPAQKKLRQAISIALDVEEYISIFLNGNAIVAQNPLPPGIFGANSDLKGVNSFVYDVDKTTGKIKRKSLQYAKKLLTQAGYPNGIDPKTGRPLVLYYDTVISGSAESNASFAWVRKQFKKLGIELVVRATQYSRFQDKLRTGDAQIYFFGWNADYPDPDNFLFLLYGKNSKVKFDGENASNYNNPVFDQLFEKMKRMPNSLEREQIIAKMMHLIQEDAPWIWGFHPKIFVLRQGWVAPFKSNPLARNTLKYMTLDPNLRNTLRRQWNQPIWWPLILGGVTLFILGLPAVFSYWRRTYRPYVLKAAKKLKE